MNIKFAALLAAAALSVAACEQQGQEGAFLRSAMPYAIAYVIIAGITVYCFTAFAL